MHAAKRLFHHSMDNEMNTQDKLVERARFNEWLNHIEPFRTTTEVKAAWEGWQAHAAEASQAQDAKDAAAPLKGWIFDKVDMGRGDERYICTPDGANATTVRNESTADHRERMLWLIADAMAKESGNG